MFGFHYLDMTIFWGAVVLIVLISNIFGYLGRASKNRVIQKMVESGQTVSPEFLAGTLGNGNGQRYRNPIQSGIFLICIGIALAVFFWALGGGGNFFEGEHVPNWLPVIGIFPFMVGLARLLGGLTERRPPK